MLKQVDRKCSDLGLEIRPDKCTCVSYVFDCHKINSRTSLLKRWLQIPRCATLASIFHLAVTNFPYLPHVQEKAKLSLLSHGHIRLSQDRNIVEMEDMILEPEFAKRESIPLRSLETLSSKPPSVSLPTHAKALMRSLNSSLTKEHAAYWSHHLESLLVQSKFLDVVILEQQSNAWSRIMFFLPAEQMYWIYMQLVYIDCLPPPVNLCQWRL